MNTTLLNNRYQIIQVLGAGGFSETFLAEDTYMPSRRRCVIKQINLATQEPKMYQTLQQRFQREAAILESLGDGSNQIPKLYAYFSENGQFYLVQEWIQGRTLTEIVKAQGSLSEPVVRDILVSLLPVLDYVHGQGIIHRDIKPDNIIVRQSDSKPVLIDFGAVKETIATTIHSQGKTNYSIVVGTPGFMPPEQAAGRPIYATDLYSLGLTAIYLLTAKLPQELETDDNNDELLWQRHALNVSPHLAGVLNRAIQYHPRDRYTTAAKMLDALQTNASINPSRQTSTQATVVVSPAKKESNQPAQTSSPQKTAPNNHSSRRNWQQSLILGCLVIGGLLATAVLTSLRNQPPASTRGQPIAQSTPAADNSVPASEPAAAPPSAPAAPPPVSAPQQEQEQNQPTSNNPSQTIPGFPTGTSYRTIRATLGNPNQISRGVWPNTRAVLYKIVPEQVTLGYLFDRTSGRLRQTEVAFAQSVEPQVMQTTLKQMLGDRTFVNISQGLQQVYLRRSNKYSFNTGELEGVIERNSSDRIYIGIWEADLH